MEIRPGLSVDEHRLAAYCLRLAAFGSVLGDRCLPASDIDLLVEFEPGQLPGLMTLAAMDSNSANSSPAGRSSCARTRI